MRWVAGAIVVAGALVACAILIVAAQNRSASARAHRCDRWNEAVRDARKDHAVRTPDWVMLRDGTSVERPRGCVDPG